MADDPLPTAAPLELATVRETLGHASLTTTGRYLHAHPVKSSGDFLAV